MFHDEQGGVVLVINSPEHGELKRRIPPLMVKLAQAKLGKLPLGEVSA